MSKPADYIEVHERMATFLERYPEGSLAMDPPVLLEIGGQTYLLGQARAYRTPDDPAPGVGTAWEPVPGTTNFTRGSEAQNLETSAWGRAMAALGIETKRGIASAQEVRAAQARQQNPPRTDVDTLARGIALADLDQLRKLWMTYHEHPQWPEIEPLIAHRRAELEARDE